MDQLLHDAVPGVPFGCGFALLAVGLVLTYRATGVFNLAFGAQSFVAAFLYDWLDQYQHLGQPLTLVVAVVVACPALGLAMDWLLFRHIPTSSTTVKVISSLGLLVAIPQLVPVVFGSTPLGRIGYLWLNPNTVELRVLSTPVNGAEVSTAVITVAVVVALAAVFRFTGAGLAMRAVVESRRLAQLQGVRAGRVEAGAWALSSLLAGLAGVLLLPTQNTLDPTAPLQFTALLVAGMTAAALAGLRSLWGALASGIALGVLESGLQAVMPPGTLLARAVLPALPFVVLVVVLVSHPALRHLEDRRDPMAAVDPPPPPPATTGRDPRLERAMRWGWRGGLALFVLSVATWIPDNWVFALIQGAVLSLLFLSITLITGTGGQLSLCQASFAGIGAFTAGQLADHVGMPVLFGAVLGAVVAAAVGAAVGVLVLRISGLLLTLVTLAFALFADSVVFQLSWFGGGLNPVAMPRPQIATVSFADDRSFLLLSLVLLALGMAVVGLVQRGTTGRFADAMRGSPRAAAALGIDVGHLKLVLFALSAGIAGFAGVLYGAAQQTVTPTDFSYVLSLAYVVVVLTTGVRSVEGAVQAGMAFAVLQQAFTYLPHRFGGLELVLFAAGALTYARHPEGMVELQKTRWLHRVNRLLQAWDERRADSPAPPSPAEMSEAAGG